MSFPPDRHHYIVLYNSPSNRLTWLLTSFSLFFYGSGDTCYVRYIVFTGLFVRFF